MAICTSALAVVATLSFGGWHPAPTAYEATVQSYQGGRTVQRDIAPQRVQPLTEGSSARRASPLRLADSEGGGEQNGVDTTYLRR
ncbi:MAG: hypothetical protein J0H14_21180 [Alphaproteobacteria bacterium]|nr:hypothetical protein [Rhodospirillales bacterium]MBN9563211.1 hypothetical protein [Alphaproteobacteria bacterium]